VREDSIQTAIVRVGIGFVAVIFMLAVAQAAEEKVAPDKVPSAVMDTVKARFKDAKVTAAAKETEDDKPVYEVTIKVKDQKIDVTLTPAGELLMIEKTIASKDLPKTVAKALLDKYGKAEHKIVEEIFKVEKKKENLAYYEVLLAKADKQLLEVQIDASGKIVNVEEKKEGEE
jgi:uncharacterized membrane protein YkoI